MTKTCVQRYASPLGGIVFAADEIGLTGLWFDDATFRADSLPAEYEEHETAALAAARRWLDVYFAGRKPDFTPPLHPVGSPFRREVWGILLKIPYGETVTYDEIAHELAVREGRARMSAQAIGEKTGIPAVSQAIAQRLAEVCSDSRDRELPESSSCASHYVRRMKAKVR